ncbi:MAG: glycosyltransferase, partial [Methylococcaceae bacterium]|nr:glycosyltransferase [Methylococcaceae bacterium]
IRQDMPAVYNALDLAVSASLFGEGVSNMIGEAMACGIPCVTTDVGDSAWMVGETGVVVIPGQPEALAQGIQTQLERLERQGESLGLAARQHIETHLSVDALIDNTIHALERLP